MDDERPPGSLADDPGFLAGLQDLDRGLGPEEGRGRRGADNPAPHGSERPADPLAADSASDPFDFLTDAVFEGHAPVATTPVLPRSRRPLLDLFPLPAVDGKRPPASCLPTVPAPPPSPVVQGDTAAAITPPPPAYAAFYGLAETPFGSSSDPRFFYPAASHTHVLNAVLEAIHAAERLIVLTGEEGVGKTTLCHIVARDLDRRTVLSFVLDPPQSIDQLLQTVLADFGVLSRADLAGVAVRVPREALTATLASFLKSLAPLQANAVVVIDEAQEMPADVLAAIPDVAAALGASRLLKIVLVGQPALTPMLERAGLRARGGRSGVRLELRRLADDEIAPYIRHRIHVVDSRARVDFSPAAIARIEQLSGGLPLRINQLCDCALVQGGADAAGIIDTSLVDRAAADRSLQTPPARPRPVVRAGVIAGAILALILVGGAGAVWVFRDAASRAFWQWLEVPPARPAPVPLRPEPAPPLPVPDNALPPADNLPVRPRV